MRNDRERSTESRCCGKTVGEEPHDPPNGRRDLFLGGGDTRAKAQRLQRQYREVEIDEADYRREPELTRTELAALVVPGHGEIVQVGDHVEGIVLAWQAAKKEEGRDLPRLMLDAVYVDMDTKKVTTETR